MSKMFVHYSGTLAAFKSNTELAEKYKNHIVFIKGNETSSGAIYTHGKYFADADALKYFSKVSDGTTVAEAAGPNGTITFTANDPALLAVDATTKGITISLTSAFVDKVNNTAADLGSKTADAATGAEATAFGRIKNLETIVASLTGEEGGEVESIDTKITNVINALDVDAKAGDYVASVKQVDGKIEATMGTFNFDAAGTAETAKSEVIGASTDASTANTVYGAKKYAEEKASAAETAAKSYADNLVAEGSALEVRVKNNEDAIDVLNGEGAGSVKKQVADAVAGVVASAPEDFDTLKEVADWIASDTTGAAKMQADIATLKGADTIEGSVAKTVKDAVAAEATIARAAEQANADDIDAAEVRIKAIEDDYLKAADKTELQGNIDTKVAQTDYNTKVAALEKADTDNLATAKKHADDAIAALNVADTAVENQFVTAVSETGGKITVSRSAINASQIGITNTENDAFAATTQNVQDALTELAEFWAWEEL